MGLKKMRALSVRVPRQRMLAIVFILATASTIKVSAIATHTYTQRNTLVLCIHVVDSLLYAIHTQPLAL